MSDTTSEQKLVEPTQDQEHGAVNNQEPSSQLKLQQEMTEILHKLKNNPSSITTEDARRLSENAEARDERSARIISAVESLAVANVEVHKKDSDLGQVPHTNLLTVVQDLNAAVIRNPEDVTPDVLKGAQSVVSSKCILLAQYISLRRLAPLAHSLNCQMICHSLNISAWLPLTLSQRCRKLSASIPCLNLN